MNVLSLFSGIGAFEKALDRLQIPYKLIGFSEIDKYAVKSYCVIHGVDESKNLGDITKINEKTLPKNIDLITYGFPCQDISNNGRMKGILSNDIVQLLHDMGFADPEIADLAKWIGNARHTYDEIRKHLFNEYSLNMCECDVLIKNGINESTRSGLFFQALRIIEHCQPKVAIAENVKNLTSKKFSDQFKIVLDSLNQAGYNNYWKVLNAKDFGVPQNRERVFIVSIRKDIDPGTFDFPEGKLLESRLLDLLEENVDESYFIDSEYSLFDVKTEEAEKPRCLQVGELNIRAMDCVKRIYSPKGLSPTLTSMQGGNRQPKVLVREATKAGYAEAYEGDSINLEFPNSKTRRGRVGRQIAQTLTTSPQQAVVDNLRPRKLIPKECWRLMDFSDEDFEKAATINSNCQLYKQAGNSIVVAVPKAIIKALCDANILKGYTEEEQ